MTDNETELLQRVLKECEKADLSAIAAIGVLNVAATLMTSQSYDLTNKTDA